MTRQEALILLQKNIKNQNLIKHSLSVEAIMKGLACRFSQDEEKWGLTGLLHDIDYEETQNNPKQHSLIGANLLEKSGIDKDICQAVKVHNKIHEILPKTLMEKALYITDPLSGLIVAAVLVLPSKKINDLEIKSLLNRFKEKSFAKGANREIISKCQEYLNLSLEEFFGISLQSMKKISKDLDL